jgi:hypothetical protein
MDLEADLRRAAELFDPVPPHLVRGAISAFTWRTIDAELAELVFDSLDQPLAVRGPGQPRLLTFRADEVVVEVELDDQLLVGRVSPATAAEVRVQHGGVEVAVTADGLGRFTVRGLASGPLRLRCTFDDGRSLVTDWIAA